MMRRMVAVISDLHFEEEAHDTVGLDLVTDKALLTDPIRFIRNIPPSIFEWMVTDIVGLARDNAISTLEFVLAGDIFDLHRTQLWFSEDASGAEPLRPYVDNNTVQAGSALERQILVILDAIAQEPRVGGSLEVFRRLAAGTFLATPGDPTSLQRIGIDTQLRYLPGNHDRLVNATAASRARVRALLSLAPQPDPFPHQFLFDQPAVLVRHGHEYDRFNFSRDLSGQTIEPELPPKDYDRATFGDFVTVQIAARLPFLFRRCYPDSVILGDEVMRAVYLRMLQFDDLRPQSAVLDFFISTAVPPHLQARHTQRHWREQMWLRLKPVVRRLLDEVSRDPYFHKVSAGLLPWWMRGLLWLRPWRFGIPLWLAQLGARVMRQSDGTAPHFAARERALESLVDFVAAGHTHNPQVAHLKSAASQKKYFVDTGTWRNAVLTAVNGQSFGRLNAMTYVAFFAPASTPESSRAVAVPRGFEYWSGFHQNWPVDEYDQ
jgi:UDP-2,3-diacylglucosamine pyrophosphatase LpxH